MFAAKQPSPDVPVELRAARSRAGKLGSASRWGGRRIVRLDGLDTHVRAAILALVAADEAAHSADAELSPAHEAA